MSDNSCQVLFSKLVIIYDILEKSEKLRDFMQGLRAGNRQNMMPLRVFWVDRLGEASLISHFTLIRAGGRPQRSSGTVPIPVEKNSRFTETKKQRCRYVCVSGKNTFMEMRDNVIGMFSPERTHRGVLLRKHGDSFVSQLHDTNPFSSSALHFIYI